MADAEAADREIRNQLDIIQSMIDVSAQRLEGLRTQCATTAELTQQEIRTLEGKLIKLFSDQLIKKLALRSGGADQIPSLIQWLQVVGLSGNSIQGLCQKISTVEELQEKSEHELRTILNDRGARPEELSRLCRALHNLKRYTDALKRGAKDNSDMHLYWDSWDRHQNFKVGGLSPRTSRTRAARASVPSEESLCNNNNRGGAIPPSSSVSSINSLNADRCVLGPPLTPPPLKGKGMKFPTTPPARRKHLTGIQNPVLLSESFPLTKSKSHESQLAKGDNGELPSGEKGSGKRSRLPTEPGPDTDYTSPILTSPIKSPPYNNTGTDSDDNSYKSAPSLQVPKSPRTPTPVGRSMAHQINHRFTKTFKMIATCGYCQKPIYFGAGLKCKECKYTCHRECEDRVTPSCGLPPELLDEFKKKLSCEVQVFPSPNPSRASNTKNIINSLRMRKRSHPQPSINIAPFPPPDSSSNTSSCNSSTPSSPAVTSIPTPHASHKQFHFPDLDPNESYEMPIETDPLNTLHHDQQSRDSDRTASVSGSTDSDKTPVRVDSQESQVSDTETITDGHRWPRQNSMSMREWDIPYEELKMGEVIGTGRFGTVYRGYWHGDVAVKVLNMSYLSDEKTLEQFKNEVSTFRKTRHENVILFMGACMQPPKLAIVTSLSKGMTLYTHIHLRKDKFNMNKTTIVAQQISQGMGYLHARGIVHKDLKSKNIFLENGKVVITDFGLFSVTKLCFGNRQNDGLSIPPGWLCYLSPEIIKKLHAHQLHAEELPFSKASDVYAFGTVWYELLCSEWPFKSQPPEAIIWQVGKGMKQPLANLQASRDVKDILMLCWSYREEDRPDFIRLVNILDKLPKKRLARSPSHPIHLSRSAESVF
ncbi:kinase suppressor of Ras 2 isoform X1 [Tribolium castaneum]|uniref:Kinase suppressor of Ras 2-like Protein n=1 Tax=Tribolium castaneum TaxID=7070 RepID=D6WVL9_TRICA|nr:PREDICTED: kinase suppressor of Ras 2 isoform X1 [Tribolium castaneum]EFA08276.1 Kinase suppressor of Ras 2-like Protein [Tribolium castaneum]|eukprot:XP_001812757.1 PREDICTED: kinase suppressor of Ras 2 isoform X1 [Tribolium castaneum]